jgi:site-specific recombinase XerD
LEYIIDNQITDNLFDFKSLSWHLYYKDAVKKCLSWNATTHDLRRARATHWIMDGLDITRVKNRLGHASISTTQLYVMPDDEKELELWSEEYKKKEK